jgi:hypothetical protein
MKERFHKQDITELILVQRSTMLSEPKILGQLTHERNKLNFNKTH